jgi:SAM-dependent methyltransferase
MPKCSDCIKLSGKQCQAYDQARAVLHRELPPPPLGACPIAIVERYVQLIGPGMRVLEIGCGSWDWIRRRCVEVEAQYEGIDSQDEYFGRKTVATRLENLAQLSFPNESFDIVVGTQTMEHWAEHGCTIEWGLYQCFRVCKPRGNVFMNVPIHFHGTREFMLGDLTTLRRAFAAFSNQVSFESWGYPPDQLQPTFPYTGFWPLVRRPAYVLDIRAVKDRSLPEGYNNRGAWTGRLAELFNYPVSYNVYRVLRKVGLFP